MLQNYTKISNDKIIVQNFILQIDAEVGALVLVADTFSWGGRSSRTDTDSYWPRA